MSQIDTSRLNQTQILSQNFEILAKSWKKPVIVCCEPGSYFILPLAIFQYIYGASPRRISYRLFRWDSSWFHSFPRPGKVDVLSCDVEAMIGSHCAPNWGFHCNFAPSQFSAGSILSLKGTHYTKNSYVMIWKSWSQSWKMTTWHGNHILDRCSNSRSFALFICSCF